MLIRMKVKKIRQARYLIPYITQVPSLQKIFVLPVITRNMSNARASHFSFMNLKHAGKYYKLNILADTPYMNSVKTWHRRQNRVVISQTDQPGLKFQDYYLSLCYTMQVT